MSFNDGWDALAQMLTADAADGCTADVVRLDGDMVAAKEIGDRLDGKPNQTQDVNVTQRMVVEAPLPAKTTEEWLERAGVHGPH